MCGIVGYIGNNQASGILLDGLRRLEYRGYDSAGMVVYNGNDLQTARVVGKVIGLTNLLNENSISGCAGIAHTRWATHGEPSERNAHPHTGSDSVVHVVHNGIVENYKSLKQELISQGNEFSSDTDTEVIAHLVEKFIKEGSSLEQSVKKALKLIKGTYALLVMSKTEPDKIIAARLSSPLRIGVGKDQFIIASDPSAILNYTQQVITLGDKEIAVISKDGYQISALNDDSIVDREIEKIEWDLEEIEKGGFDHFMLKEIFEQPDAIKNSLRGRLIPEEGLAKLGGLSVIEDRLRKIKRLNIVACGTAYHAGMVGEYMLEEYAGIPVEVCVASEFRYRKPILNPEEDAMLILSQSGETADTLAAVKEAKEKNVMTLGIVNTVGSTIVQETSAGIYNHAGPEIGVASTKVFVSQLTILALLTVFLGRQRDMSLIMGQRIISELSKLPTLVDEILKQNDLISNIAKKYLDYKNFFYLGRKYNFPIALEGALKFKEISYIHAEGGSSGELKHGPLAMIDEDFPSVFICPKDSVYEKNISNMEEVKARRGKIIAIATQGDTEVPKIADDVIFIPKSLEMLTPILSVVPLQLFAYHFANHLGLDVDRPRNLAKSVTVE